jgi:antitoxin CptB
MAAANLTREEVDAAACVAPAATAGAAAGAEKDAAATGTDLGRLRWRCRRGMRELDVLLERYVDERFGGASDEDQRAFIELLDTQDTVIYAYCLGQEPPPPRFAGLIERITAKSSHGR